MTLALANEVAVYPADGIRIDGVLDEPAWQAAPAARDFLRFQPTEGGEPPGVTEVRDEARRLALRMVETQLPDGHWHCMVHEPRSGPESSTAAFMATAFYRGMSGGLLDPDIFAEPADRAWRAMCGKLDGEGNLTGVSAAVMSALVEEHYWHVPLDRIVPWGQGPVLTAEAARRAWAGAR